MVSNTSFNSITSSDKQAVQSIGSSHPNFVESNDVERGERCICQLLSRNDNSIPIKIEEEILELSNRSSSFNQGMKTVLKGFVDEGRN